MDVEIRIANESDLPAILRLYAQPEIDNGAVLGIDEAKTLFRRMASYPMYSLYVACAEEKVVGSFALLVMDNLGHLGAPSGIVEDVVVDPNLHGMGIGKKMMTYAIDTCHRHHCYKIALSANRKRKNAHKFYESLGFEKHGYSFVISD